MFNHKLVYNPRIICPNTLQIFSYLVSTKGLELITCLSLAVTLSVFISMLFSLYQIMYIFSIKFIYLFIKNKIYLKCYSLNETYITCLHNVVRKAMN